MTFLASYYKTSRMIYLDANASSRLRPSVRQFLSSEHSYFNPSSVHAEGRKARAAIRNAKEEILNFLNCANAELIFTSGGTESCNLMIKGFLGDTDSEIISSVIEHSAIKEVISNSEVKSYSVKSNGVIDVSEVASLVSSRTQLVNLMMVNNESGMIQPIKELCLSLRENAYKGLIVSDAIQAFGKIKFDLQELFTAGLDCISISGHKVGAPSGIGALVYSKDNEQCRMFSPQIVGGAQQGGFRAGTENVIGTVAFAKAVSELSEKLDDEIKRKKELSLKLLDLLKKELTGIHWYGERENWVGNTLLLGFENCLGSDLVAALDLNGVAVSTGAACASGKQGVSDTVNAMQADSKKAKEVIRISLDWDTTIESITQVSKIITKVVTQIRAIN